MIRAALCLICIMGTPLIVSAQSGFWYPSCSSGRCVSPAPCPSQGYATQRVVPSAAAPAIVAPVAAAMIPVSPAPPSNPAPNAPPAPEPDQRLPPALPYAAQPSPSDGGSTNQDEELATLRRELERLKLRNQEFETTIETLREAQRSQDENVQRQLKSIFESVAKLKPADSDEAVARSARELRELVEALPGLIDESVRLRVEELSKARPEPRERAGGTDQDDKTPPPTPRRPGRRNQRSGADDPPAAGQGDRDKASDDDRRPRKVLQDF